MNSSVAITLEAVGDHLETAFNVTVVTMDGSATRGCIPYMCKFTGNELTHECSLHEGFYFYEPLA